MGSLVFRIFYSLNWVFTLLPLRVLYGFSYILFVIFYHFPGYRKKVVALNLRNSFPEKTVAELKIIERNFYRHLADMFIETLKLSHMSAKQLSRRFVVNDKGLLDRLYNEKRDIIAILGHYNNWEWMAILPLFTDYRTISIYKPLHNKHFDRFLNTLRSRFGMVLTPMSMIVREILNNRKTGINTCSAFISDQTPARDDIKFWTTFLNQDTAVYLGAEKVASKYDMAVVFFHIRKIKRGYYSLDIDLLFEHTAGLPEFLITETHVKKLEQIIREKPEHWIWSHRRWKHKRAC